MKIFRHTYKILGYISVLHNHYQCTTKFSGEFRKLSLSLEGRVSVNLKNVGTKGCGHVRIFLTEARDPPTKPNLGQILAVLIVDLNIS